MMQTDCYIYNGYSNYRKGQTEKKQFDHFTISMEVVPYTYESGKSGILSAFSKKESQGILIAVGKRGMVTVNVGIGTMIVEIASLQRHLDYQKSNLITFVFWGEAGWCDLYVNGVLSNRKQFPRHSKLMIPKGEFFQGKLVDGSDYVEATRHGHFHGSVRMFGWEEQYRSYDEVISMHEHYPMEEVGDIDLYELHEELSDIYRPTYHLMPPKKWMNEPHAPFYYEGTYHIFYQANPHAPVWDNLSWGHLISKDMVIWKDAGIALNPDDDRDGIDCDIDGCWSGSACLDELGRPILFYTAGDNRDLPNQRVATAVPRDDRDPNLREWRRQGVVLRQTIGQGFLGEFRDPFVWRVKDTYYMLVGTGDADNGGGNALVYTSKNLRDYVCHGFVMDYDYEQNQECGHVWELPVMLPLYDDNLQHVCDILLLCACQIEQEIVETYYFLGEFDEEECRFKKYHEKAMLLDLGNGTFTGPSGFVTPDKRSVVFTITQGKRGPVEYEAGWAHNGGMPVELSIQGGELRVNPIREASGYFSRLVYSTDSLSAEKISQEELSRIALLENRIMVTSEGRYLQFTIGYDSDAYEVIYDRDSGRLRVQLASTGEIISKCRGREDLVDIGEAPICMECYLDHSMIELYLNGRKSVTLRNYQYTDGYRVRAESDGAHQMNIWRKK